MKTNNEVIQELVDILRKEGGTLAIAKAFQDKAFELAAQLERLREEHSRCSGYCNCNHINRTDY